MIRSSTTSTARLGLSAAVLVLGTIALVSYASMDRLADGAGWVTRVIVAGNALALALGLLALVALTREIAVRRKAEQDLRQANAFLDSVFEHMPAMVFVKAAKDLTFVRHNMANQELLGYSEAQVLGKSDYDLFPKEQADFFTANDRVVLSGKIVVDIPEEPIQTKHQGVRILHTRKIPVFDADGHPQYLLGISEDITDRKLAERQIGALNERLEHRAAQLEAANKELEGFSYSVSHDLRAPIRAISGFSKLLLQDHGAQLDQEAQRKLGIVISETGRMGSLIDDLLAFSRLGRLPMRIAELDMRDLVERTYERLSAQHQGTKADFHLGILPNAMGDRALLELVWTNLLSNALKFTSKRDQPQIEVGAIGDSQEHVYFVRDNGVGFDPRFQSKLFGVFQRLYDAGDFPGTGVGLALVDRIVTRHGGRVWADSKLEEGATFYFTLPESALTSGAAPAIATTAVTRD